MTNLKGRLSSALPPHVAMRLRAEKNRRNLHGLHAPARALSSIVPSDRVAVDVGANAGLYAYWIAQAASHVHAFEPQPRVYQRLAAQSPKNVIPHNVALSDRSGTAILHIPSEKGGEASLQSLSGAVTEVEVALRTLDSYELTDVGFLKIDVEGHEEQALAGAQATLEANHPVVFIEVEERHNPGGLDRITSMFSGIGYSEASFMLRGQLLPLDVFDPKIHQSGGQPSSPDYVTNFLFRAK